MVTLFVNNKYLMKVNIENLKEVAHYVAISMNLAPADFYLEQNGKRLESVFEHQYPVYVRLCVLGGKGGFGSMLRAIGAQIEKTTNREACRDLSGRRLRDINEEKRLKAWLEKQGEREREAEERKKRKIQKLLAVPKHEFKDELYEETRSKLADKVHSALEEGLKNVSNSESCLKRKVDPSGTHNPVPEKKKKSALWLDEEISSGDDTDGSEDNVVTLENLSNKNKIRSSLNSERESNEEKKAEY